MANDTSTGTVRPTVLATATAGLTIVGNILMRVTAPATDTPPPAAPAEPQVSAPVHASSSIPLGVNLSATTYYSQSRAFMNLAGTGWRRISARGEWSYATADQFGDDGSIKSIVTGEKFATLLSAPNAVLNGQSVRIRCTWQGDGKVYPSNHVEKEVSLGSNSLSFKWTPIGKQNATIFVATSDPRNPVRALDCREADAPANLLFDPKFVESLKPYETIRFMDWMNTNANKPITWASRNTPGSGFQRKDDGVAIESMVSLANQAGVDPWFCIPWNASPDYIRNFAIYVRDNLSPNQKVYVELSNEVWNGAFPVAAQAQREGLAAGLSSNAFQAQLLRYSQRTAEVMKIWTEVFATQPSRLVRVIASQDVNPWTASQVLVFTGTAKYVDALATAPYFGHYALKGLTASANIDTIFDQLNSDVDRSIATALANKKVAKLYGKQYIAYEGGQHMLSDDVTLMERIQRDPRMENIYDRYLNAWKTQVGDLLTLYANVGPISRYGAWGMQEYEGQPAANAPKYRSVQKIVQAN